MPEVTVVIPSLNHGRFIAEAIDSVLQQEAITKEILVMDGGSTDATFQRLESYGNRIKWTSEPDSGPFEALNRGFSKAKGDIIGWLNSDDVYFSTTTLQTVVDCLRDNPEIHVLYGDVAIIGKRSDLLRLRLLPDYDRRRLERSNIISQPAVFMRRSVVEEEKLRPLVSLDYEYWIRLGRKGYRFKHIHSVLAAERQYADRLSMRLRSTMKAEFQAYKSEFGIEPLPNLLWRARDRLWLAPYRLKGFVSILGLLANYDGGHKLAFPMSIDSPLRLLGRQLSRGVLQVGI